MNLLSLLLSNLKGKGTVHPKLKRTVSFSSKGIPAGKISPFALFLSEELDKSSVKTIAFSNKKSHAPPVLSRSGIKEKELRELGFNEGTVGVFPIWFEKDLHILKPSVKVNGKVSEVFKFFPKKKNLSYGKAVSAEVEKVNQFSLIPLHGKPLKLSTKNGRFKAAKLLGSISSGDQRKEKFSSESKTQLSLLHLTSSTLNTSKLLKSLERSGKEKYFDFQAFPSLNKPTFNSEIPASSDRKNPAFPEISALIPDRNPPPLRKKISDPVPLVKLVKSDRKSGKTSAGGGKGVKNRFVFKLSKDSGRAGFKKLLPKNRDLRIELSKEQADRNTSPYGGAEKPDSGDYIKERASFFDTPIKVREQEGRESRVFHFPRSGHDFQNHSLEQSPSLDLSQDYRGEDSSRFERGNGHSQTEVEVNRHFLLKGDDLTVKISLFRQNVFNIRLDLGDSFYFSPGLVSEIREIIKESGFIPGRIVIKAKEKGFYSSNLEKEREKTVELKV